MARSREEVCKTKSEDKGKAFSSRPCKRNVCRYAMIKSHLKTWKKFVGEKKSLLELKQKDCEGYYE